MSTGTPSERAAIARRLEAVGRLDDDAIPIAETALLLSALDHPTADPAKARALLEEMSLAAESEAMARGLKTGVDAADADDGARDRAVLIADILHGRYGFDGDDETYDHDDNASLARVLERRRGLPVALGVLAMHLGETLGWPVVGVNFPAHFLIRVEGGMDRVLVDPFDRGRVVETSDLRALLKQVAGDTAELEPEHYRAVDRRAVLLRLQNNLKIRAAGRGELDRARDVLARMLLIAPTDWALWYELGLMRARLGEQLGAVQALEVFAANTTAEEPRRRALTLVERLRAELN
ncbi:SirB1 family protein [Tistrella mobilis]|uniref:Tetratricopeptide repeat family protein n=1 Tax=Tistrella mobilis (strain KA081020-065) TaxID=1110502 RepID=I3TRB4_TISMK|nr:tetratricopeptide repeat protein [Tistrella mobilis]AFK55302.1 tetratricopeptide repeat family protein [Tistrella mobilis KA081020-065]